MNPCKFTSFYVSLLIIEFSFSFGRTVRDPLFSRSKYNKYREMIFGPDFIAFFCISEGFYCLLFYSDRFLCKFYDNSTNSIYSKQILFISRVSIWIRIGEGEGGYSCMHAPPPWIRQWTQKNLSFHYKLSKVVFL